MMSIQEGHWEVDLRTGRHWTSKSWLALLGFPPDSDAYDTVEKARELIHPEDREMAHLTMRRHFAAGTPFEIEARLQLAEGGYRWFKMRGSADGSATASGFAGTNPGRQSRMSALCTATAGVRGWPA